MWYQELQDCVRYDDYVRLKGIMSIVDVTTILPICLLVAHLHSYV
jgi:hypothetical protein